MTTAPAPARTLAGTVLEEGGPVWVLVPGNLDTRTGGFIYDRHMIEGLRALGRLGGVIETADAFPGAGQAVLDDVAAEIAHIPDRAVLIVDGLAATDLSDILAREAARLRIVALIHHPLADESDADPARAGALFDAERRMLASVAGVIVTSPSTARRLSDFNVGAEAVTIALPGTDPQTPTRAPATPPRLLCLATLSRRKGQDVLLAALETLQDLDWRLDLVGAARDSVFAAELTDQIAKSPVRDRITTHGEIDPPALDEIWRSASLFVLPSRHEGYGMALAEALARGLPIVSTQAGAIPDTVPETAGLLVQPGDAPAIADALRHLLQNPAEMARHADGAQAAGQLLPTWTQAQQHFVTAIDRLVSAHSGRRP